MYRNLALLRGLLTALVVFFALVSCGEKDPENVYTLSSRKTEKPKYNSEKSTLTLQDSMVIEFPSLSSVINQNIPIKTSNNIATIITKDNVIYYFHLNRKKSKPFKAIELNHQIGQVTDYLEVGPNRFLIATYSKDLVVFDFEKSTIKLIISNNDGFVDRTRPYMGLSLIKFGNHYILPFVKINDVVNGSFLGLFDSEFNYIRGLGNSGYEGLKCHTPYYDSPIVSNINENGEFYCTYPSTPNSLLFNIASTLEFEYADEYISNIELKNLDCIDTNKLFDYKFMHQRYITDKYGMRILISEKNLYRIIKEKQEYIDSQNRTKNTILSSPFSITVSNRKTNHSKHFKFEGNKYDFLNGFIYNNLYYLPLKQNENKLTLHAYF